MKQFLSNISGFENHLIISMIIFLVFFVGMVVWLLTVDKQKINELKQLPFNNDK